MLVEYLSPTRGAEVKQNPLVKYTVDQLIFLPMGDMYITNKGFARSEFLFEQREHQMAIRLTYENFAVIPQITIVRQKDIKNSRKYFCIKFVKKLNIKYFLTFQIFFILLYISLYHIFRG